MFAPSLDRRALLGGALAGGASLLLPRWASAHILHDPAPHAPGGDGVLSGTDIALEIARTPFRLGNRTGHATTVNGTVPGPLIRLREGQNVRLRVTNRLEEDSSIHWHGLLVPFQMDGVPGITFPGIRPNESFAYEFPVRQAGTYWYHSHSGHQEAMGLFGPIVIDPAGPDPIACDREMVVMLSDWSFMHPGEILRKLKAQSDYSNYRQPTLSGLLAGQGMPLAERLRWGGMRMSPADIADVTGATYRYLVNGQGPDANWTGLFAPGERVRLRIINSSAMTIFNLRIPGLPLTVVAADGSPVRPVETDEIQIGVAETYDLIVTPGDRAYTLFAETIDRSGYARGTLAPRPGMTAPVPALRERPTLSMRDMGMGDMRGMDDMGHGTMNAAGGMKGHAAPKSALPESSAPASTRNGATVPPAAGMDAVRPAATTTPHGTAHGMAHGMAGPTAMDHASMGHSTMQHGTMGHGATPLAAATGTAPAAMTHRMRDPAQAPGVAMNPGVATIAPMPVDRTGDRGLGLDQVDHRVLVYTQLEALAPHPGFRPPAREIEVHLTGNMERYMWSFDGRRFSEIVAPIRLARDERVRFRLVNDTMMTHPIHLHGFLFDLVNGKGERAPRKHTVNVLPGGYVRFDLTADAPGDWAFHCHLMLHMAAGMFNVVTVRPLDDRKGEVA